MLEAPDILRRFNPSAAEPLAAVLRGSEEILLTGEGSSRIFPAKRERAAALRIPGGRIPLTEGCTQAMEYSLENTGVLGASNSGRTKELIRLFKSLKAAGHKRLCGITANPGTPLEETAACTLVLGCGPEEAVAATKSVMEQALVVQAVSAALSGKEFPDLKGGADALEAALNAAVPNDFADALAHADTIFFAGRNDGVAEELTLKTNEIVRKKSDFLEGTYAAHGIEEIMSKNDVVVLVNPFAEEEAKLNACLREGVGVTILAIADRETMFPTLRVPSVSHFQEYVLLAAGWNLLVAAGLAAGVNLDKPVRARKVGNEVE